MPDSVQSDLEALLRLRNLEPRTNLSESGQEGLHRLQALTHQLEWLAQTEDGSDLVLLVQTRAEFFSHLGGRYRWTVHAELSLADPEDLSRSIHRSVEIPVFMQFHHERDLEVLIGASPVLSRELAQMLDVWLSSGTKP